MLRANRFTRIAICAASLLSARCVSNPTYEGKECDPTGACPAGLVCNTDKICVALLEADAAPSPVSVRDAQASAGFADAAPQPQFDGGFSDRGVNDDGSANADGGADAGSVMGQDAAADAGSADLGICADGNRVACYTGPNGTQNQGLCHSGQSTCANGAWGPCTGEVVPAMEICNGLDDDCNGVVDDGCPNGQVVYAASPTSTPIYGGGGANVWSNVGCPDGQVVVGFHGRSGTYLDALGAHCGTLTVVESRTTVPFTYSLQVAAGFEAPERGGTGGSAYDLRCAAGEIVTGIEGHSGTLIDSVTFTCARFDIAAGSPYRIVEVGIRHAQGMTVGGTGGTAFTADCPVDYGVKQMNGSDGPFVLGMQTLTLVGSVGSICTGLAPALR